MHKYQFSAAKVFFVNQYHIIMVCNEDNAGWRFHSIFHNDGTFKDFDANLDELRSNLPLECWEWLDDSMGMDECFCVMFNLPYIAEEDNFPA